MPKAFALRPSSRCSSVAQGVRLLARDPVLHRTEGLYATIDTRTGVILHFFEMLNVERTSHKENAASIIAEQGMIR